MAVETETKAGYWIEASSTNAIVETTVGKVRGCNRNGIFTFKGIPYAAPTGGKNRFMPPEKPEPWTGVRSCLHYGHICPQSPYDDPNLGTNGDNSPVEDEDGFLLYRAYGQPAGEDCLRLNIWTPEINGSGGRPVMVYLHGGGFFVGSGQDLRSYDGESLSRKGNVVVVNLNHRLGILGFLNLAESGGESYSKSANVGMLDIVAALEWIRDNIHRFGGDPKRVMIFGQSGGGGKVTALMAMPDAKGLFHQAAIQSGSMLQMGRAEDSDELARLVLKVLNVPPGKLAELQNFSVHQLLCAGRQALQQINQNMKEPRTFDQMLRRMGWMPTVDGKTLPHQPFDPDAPEISASVPLLVGSNQNEFINGVDNPNAYELTLSGLDQRLASRYGERSTAILDAFAREYRDAKPFDLLSIIETASVRQQAVEQAVRKAALKAAPAYLYLFNYRTPVLDDRPGAFHSAEIAFVFNNLEICPNLTGGDPAARRLEDQISQAWIQFAWDGNPNHSGLPYWPEVNPGAVKTMIFDNQCAVQDDPGMSARRILLNDRV